jgi:flagellar protein FlaG
MDEASGRTVITVKDSETEEIIRQIPPESALALASFLRSEGGLESFGLIEKA